MAIVVRELLVALGVDADEASVKRFGRALDGLKKEMGAASVKANALGGVLTQVAVRAGQAIIGWGRALFDVNVQAEQLDARLQVITGSAEGANAEFQRMSDLATETPFQIANLTEALIQLGLRGFGTTNDDMRLAGDLAAAFAVDITEVTQAMASLASGEAEPFKRFGVSAKFAGNQVTLGFKGMTQTVNRDSKEIQKFLNEIVRQNFAGAMAKQMDTVGGKVSNFQDAMSTVARAMGEQGGLRAAVKELLTELIGTTEASQGLAVSFARVLSFAIRSLTSAIRFLRRHADFLKRALKGLSVALAIWGTAKVALWIKNMRLMARAMAFLSKAATIAAIKFAALGAGLLLVFLILNDLIGFAQGKDSVIGEMLDPDDAETFRQDLNDIGAAIKEVFSLIGELFGVLDISPLRIIALTIKGAIFAVALLLRAIIGVGKFLGRVAGAIWMFFRDTIPKALRAAAAKLAEWITDIESAINKALGFNLLSALREAGQAIVRFFGFVVARLGQIWGRIIAPFQEAWRRFTRRFAKGWERLTGIISKLWARATRRWNKGWERWKEILGDALVKIADALTWLTDQFQQRIVDPVKGLFSDMADFILEQIDRALGGIIDLIDKAEGAANTVAEFLGLDTGTKKPRVRSSGGPGFGERLVASRVGAVNGAGTSNQNATVNVSSMNVNVAGSTNMGEKQLERASAKGVSGGFMRTLRETQRALASG
jgi:hypothetical protein